MASAFLRDGSWANASGKPSPVGKPKLLAMVAAEIIKRHEIEAIPKVIDHTCLSLG